MAKGLAGVLEKLRADMPEDVKYVTVEREPNRMALNIFFLVGEKWRVARGVDYETLYHHDAGLFWKAVDNGGAYRPPGSDRFFEIVVEDTDDEPPKKWQAANDVAQSILHQFKLGPEFCEHMGWSREPGARIVSLAEQESMAGDILEFIGPLLMKEADAPFPRRLPLPTVACSECGAGVEVHRDEEIKGAMYVDGYVTWQHEHFYVRCRKCPPKIGPIKCDSGPVDDGEGMTLEEARERVKALAGTNSVSRGDGLPGGSMSRDELLAEVRKQEEIIRKNQEALADLNLFKLPAPWAAQATDDVKQEKPEQITMDDCLEGASGGCTCGAWVTKETHADHCDLVE